MTSATLYRTAAIVFLLFAAGHTFGFLTLTPPTTDAIAVRDAMSSVHFSVGGGTYSYGDFYRGFGLSVTLSMLFEAFLCWQLAAMVRLAPRPAASIGWALCVLQMAGFALSCIYFSIAPAAFSLALAACLGFAAWRSQTRGRLAQVAAA